MKLWRICFFTSETKIFPLFDENEKAVNTLISKVFCYEHGHPNLLIMPAPLDYRVLNRILLVPVNGSFPIELNEGFFQLS